MEGTPDMIQVEGILLQGNEVEGMEGMIHNLSYRHWNQ
jgi:hypothetical protein